LDHHLAPEVRRARAMNRRLFREMVKEQIADCPMTKAKRRAFVRFAEKLHIDTFEARLIIRAVEYECGHVAPAAMAENQTPVAGRYLCDADGHDGYRLSRFEAIWAGLLAVTGLIMWLA
jgi:hypothetical protein